MQKKRNPFGYKVQDGKETLFRAYTYRQAIEAKRYLCKYKKRASVIIPIQRSEVKDGIWRQDPFPKRERLFYFIG